jgi:GcrA cell cycle regulator
MWHLMFMICSQNTPHETFVSIAPAEPGHAPAKPDNPADPGWSRVRTELLLAHYAMGLSAAVSALLIGGVSRNAVISKRRRLGLLGANPIQSALRASRCAGRTSEPRVRPASSRPWLAPLGDDEADRRREALPFMDRPAPADADPKTLAERSPGQCAWPLGPAEAPGDYRTLFCCAPVERGRGYCATHRAIAFGGRLAPQWLESLANGQRGSSGCSTRAQIVRRPR